MADSKISALPASTTPLAGTEVLPIVQGGTTKKVSIANVTAGRAVSMASLAVGGNGIFTETSPQILAIGAGSDANGAGPAFGVVSNSSADQYYMRMNSAKQLTFYGYDQSNSTLAWSSLAAADGGKWQFYTASVERMRIFQSGGISIGDTTDPSAGNLRLGTGNLVIGTSGKGIDTSAAHAVTFSINSSEAARIHASKGVSIGNTVDPGATNLSVTGSVTNASIKTGSGLLTNNLSAPEIMFSAADQGIYIVFAYIEAYDPNDWSAQATVTSSGAGILKLTTVNSAGMQITVSGNNVLSQQIGGGGSALGTKYVYQKII